MLGKWERLYSRGIGDDDRKPRPSPDKKPIDKIAAIKPWLCIICKRIRFENFESISIDLGKYAIDKKIRFVEFS